MRRLPAAVAPSPTATPIAFRAAVGFGPGFVDIDRAATQVRSIEAGDGLIGFLGIRHFDERETAGAACVAVGHQAYPFHGAVCLEGRANGVLRCAEIQVTDKYFFH